MKKSDLKIYIFRHGETTYNRDEKFTGSNDARLTAKGRKQAKVIAEKLKNKKFQVAIRSGLSRSIDTLTPVLKFHPECKLILEENRITERNYGDLQGTTHEDFIKRIGKRGYDLRVEGDAIQDLEPRLKRKVQRFLGEEEYKAIHRGFNVAPPGGESFADVEKRVKDFIKDLKKFMKKHKVNVAISGHGNSIRLFRKIMENSSIRETTSWNIPYDKIFTYTV
jgi:2,3-bisphosphoglycerate-dependent phosphoglycerate mutase